MAEINRFDIRALVFDVFGTVVDWRSSVIRECKAVGDHIGLELDWGAFADEWRYDGYMAGIGKVRRGELPFMTADELHLRKLKELAAQHGIGEDRVDEIGLLNWNDAWHRLDPWPDSVAGLERLRSKYICSTLSNGNVRLLVDMARHANLRWDCVLSAEITGAFKPDAECYLAATRILMLQPEQVLMVAAHKADLLAAAKVGLQTAFVPRPGEAGPNRKVDLEPDPSFGVVATDFHDLATKLGCR